MIAVETELKAREPDFQVPNPTAGMMCPVGSRKSSSFSPVGVKVALNIFSVVL